MRSSIPVTKIIKIDTDELFARLVNSEKFVIRVGNQHLTPEYGSFKLARGNLIAFIGLTAGAVEIGIIATNASSADETVGIRILERIGAPKGNHRWHNVHLADILCLLNPYKKEKKLWRLWMEYPGIKGMENCTIRVDEDLDLLVDTRTKLMRECVYPEKYHYIIEEVLDV